MATSKSRKSICDLHSNEEATVMCLKHHQLMCLDCVLEQKHKLHDCIIKGIEKLLPSEKYQYELILLRRGLVDKKLAVAQHTTQVGKKREDLKDEVEKHFQELVQKLQDIKKDSLKDLEEQAKILHDRDLFEMKQIEEIELHVKTNIEKLDDISHGTHDDELQELRRKEETLIPEICPSAVRGYFSPYVILDCNTKSLGKIEFFDIDSTVSSSDDYLRPKSYTEQTVSAVVAQSLQSNVVSDIVNTSGIHITSTTETPPVIGPKPKPRQKSKDLDRGSNEHAKLLPTDATQDMTDFPALPTVGKSDVRNMGIKEKNKLRTISKDLQDIPKPDFEKLKDKTVKLESGKKMSLPKAVSFTEVVITDLHNIILLDKTGNIIVMADFSGQVKCSKDVRGAQRLVCMQDGCFAIFNGKKIQMYGTSSDNFIPSKKKIEGLKNEIPYMTGFNYNCQTKQFAVSGLDKNAEMKVIFVKDSGEKDASVLLYKQTQPYDFNMIRTTYSFDANKLFCMNIEKKSMKCVACDTKILDWAQKCSDGDFCPREMTLRGNLLLVTSPSCIFIFSKNDGETKKKIPTETLLRDIHGICFIEEEQLAVVTSISKDRDASLTLGFVSI
ncbi:uncharacterized protein LOC127869053 [Dreissena polymorpha]|uniref:B box-type domain-containing protein n=1 Tax=Dreissena polymorpha TaxID=45954 RepID=A0A9D4MEA7_DREPO|nr:uncharacterized protein LOC127869053 [Dreissena polymorpha]KAH3873626.1 hypothetical protein DPMN_036863 [Dreissena polymorpha]